MFTDYLRLRRLLTTFNVLYIFKYYLYINNVIFLRKKAPVGRYRQDKSILTTSNDFKSLERFQTMFMN